MYIHYTYDTIYPEYILAIEPIPKSIVDSTKSLSENNIQKYNSMGDSGVQFARKSTNGGLSSDPNGLNQQASDNIISNIKVEMGSDIFQNDVYYKLYTTHLNMQIEEVKSRINEIKQQVKQHVNNFWK